MAMPVSIGDIVTLLSIIRKLYVAFNTAHGSAAEYRDTIGGIESFHVQLDCVEHLAVPLAQEHGATDLASSILVNVETSKQATERYLSKMRQYGKVFGKDKKQMNAILRTFRKTEWFFRHAGDASELRQRLQANRSSLIVDLQLLNILLVRCVLEELQKDSARTSYAGQVIEGLVNNILSMTCGRLLDAKASTPPFDSSDTLHPVRVRVQPVPVPQARKQNRMVHKCEDITTTTTHKHTCTTIDTGQAEYYWSSTPHCGGQESEETLC